MNKKASNPNLYKAIFDSSVEGILVVGHDGSILEANKAGESIFGYAQGDLAGKKVEVLIPQKLEKKHTLYRRDYSKKPTVRSMGQNLDLWGLRKDGSQFPLKISLTPTKIDGQQVVVAFVADITEQKKAEVTSLESNRKYSTLIDNLNGIVYRCRNDRNWTMEYISDGCLPITGYSPRDFLEGNLHFSDITFKEDQEEVWNKTQKGIHEKRPFEISFRITHKEGTIKYLNEIGQGIFDQDGNLEALEGFITDVTEQKKIELQLRENEAKNKALLEALPDMMFITNYDGEFLEWFTREPEKLFVLPENLIGKNMKDVLPAHINKILKNTHELVRHDGKIQIVEYSEIMGKSEMFWEARTVPLNQHALLTIVRDITEKKRTEGELETALSQNKALIQAIPDTVLTLDPKGNYLEIYTTGSNNWLVPKEDLVGLNIKKSLSKTNYKIVKTALDNTLLLGETQQVEYDIERTNGMRHYETRFVLLQEDKVLVIARDITVRKRIEKNLFIKNRALAAAGNGRWIADAKLADQPIIYANNAFYQMTGYNRDEVLGKNCRFLQNDDRNQKEIAIMAKAIEKGESCQLTLRNYKKDGTLFWNELTITPVRDEYDNLTHFIGVQNDVTHRKNEELFKDHIRKILERIVAHKPLKNIGNEIVKTLELSIAESMASILVFDTKSETLHKLVAPNLPKPFSNAIEGTGIGVNIGSCGTTAFQKKAVVVPDISKNKNCGEFRSLALENELRACWSYPVLSSDKKVLGTFAIYHKTAKTPTKRQKETIADLVQLTSIALEQYRVQEELDKSRWLLEDYAKELEQKVAERTDELKSTVKQLVETNLKLKDQVAETKAAESRALESQTMFTAISKNFPKGVIIVFNSNYEIVYIDGGEIRRIGYDKNQFEGLHIDDIDIFSKIRIERIKKDIKRTFEGDQLSFEIRLWNKSYTVNTSPLQSGNDAVKWALFVYNDISRQKQAEADIRSALVREQELNELKSRFISMASHEFRTPLSAISTSAILIDKQNMPGKEEKRKKYVAQIQNNVRNLVVILNDFLSLSKLEEGKVKSKPEHFNLIEFVNNLMGEMQPNRKRGQKIKLISRAGSVPVYLDSKLLQHVFTNLLSNAIKYSEEGTLITVTLKDENQKVSVSVTDQGIGIPIEEQDNLFDRFFRAENSTNIQGTGLGLHIVKQYTELMGGIVSFESEVGRGSTFKVEFKSPLTTGKETN